MKARVVIGANFGDEGKGLVTDYLCATQGAGMVVRFNGGAQAGHTVVTPDKKRHVFHHFGSGVFCNVPTYLSRYFICNPILFFDELSKFETTPVVYAHPECLVTTFADMVINQRLEHKRGANRHGSVGVGINETVDRSRVNRLRITMADVWNHVSLKDRLVEICGDYAKFRTGAAIPDTEEMIEAFIKALDLFAGAVNPLGIDKCKDPVFEGAQGLLLDQNNKAYYPHLTRSNTGMRNVTKLCAQAGITDIETYYVSRTYLTRHGAGLLPGEDLKMKFVDDTNTDHNFQGALRFAPLDYVSLLQRCASDHQDTNYKLVLTHCDQVPPPAPADLYSWGPTRNDIYLKDHPIVGDIFTKAVVPVKPKKVEPLF